MTQGRPKRAATVAVATPCWPAPVSAMIRVLPMRRASRIWPMQLLILCAPVWSRSSGWLRKLLGLVAMRAPSEVAGRVGEGRHLVHVLDPGRTLDARRDVDQ